MEESPQTGDIIAERFVLGRLLGEGALAQVYEIEERDTGRLLAAKLLRPRFRHEPLIAQRFVTEAQVLGALCHPHIVAFECLLAHPLGIVEQLITGESLASLLARCGKGLGAPLALHLIKQAAEALHFAHLAGVIHRDVKPSNFLIERTGHAPRLFVADFGLAKVNQLRRTVTGTVLGSFDYMAPEQLADASRVDERSDIYALGLTLFHCLAGKLPTHGLCIQDMILYKEQHRLPALSPTDLQLPQLIDRIIEQACASRPEQRYPNMKAFLQALHAATALVGTPSGLGAHDTSPMLAIGSQPGAVVPQMSSRGVDAQAMTIEAPKPSPFAATEPIDLRAERPGLDDTLPQDKQDVVSDTIPIEASQSTAQATPRSSSSAQAPSALLFFALLLTAILLIASLGLMWLLFVG
ncbi:MAG: serine/threonine-protein kinase [Myxococcota bacterium]|jgi:serine/threonine-protein kinase|nr:serine/threonine-protein kinase [Myxococcota bacterium]